MKKINLMILALCFALPLFAASPKYYVAQNDEYNYLLYKYEDLPIETAKKERLAKENLIIPSDLKVIAHGSFKGNSSVRTVTISEGVTTIGEDAFSGCTLLKRVTIPNSVTTIEGRAFFGCDSLASVTIPDSVTSIGWSAFEDCSSLKDIYFKGTKKRWEKINEDENLQKGKIRIDYKKKSVKLHFAK